MAGSVEQAAATPASMSTSKPMQLVAPTGRPPPSDRYRRDLPPETLAGCTSRWSSPANSTSNSSTCSARASWRCSRRAAARRPPRSARRRACARPTGCSRSTARSARSCSAASRRRRWARSGAASGTAGWASPRSACAPIAIPIGTHGLHAVGAAMAAQRLGEDSVTVAFLGDGATSEGDAHEALNFAAVFKAPCVFFVQNNQWAISVPVSHQMAAPSIAHRAIGYGMPGIRVDGNDVLACYAVMAEAAAAGTRRRRPDADRGGHLSDGSAHHLRRPDPIPVRTRKSSNGPPATRSRGTAPTCSRSGCGPSGSRSGSRPSRNDCAPNCATRWSTPRTSTSPRCSTPSTTTSPRTWRPSANSCCAELAKEA